MRNFAVLLAMIGVFTVFMGPSIGLSFFGSSRQPPGPPPKVSSICAQAFVEAAAASGAVPRSEALDPAVRSCASVKEWEVAARAHPAILGGAEPRRVLAQRCRDRSAGLARYATCRDLGDYRVPDPKPGSLTILAPAAVERTVSEPGVGVEIILDTSGSMLDKVDGERRIDVAKHSLATVVRRALADGLLVAIRTFRSIDEPDGDGRSGAGRTRGDAPRDQQGDGAGRAESGEYDPSRCLTELTLPVTPLERDSMLQLLEQLSAGKRTSTPIAASLAAVAQDLAGISGRRTIVLVTDGAETCGGDPIAEVERLRATWPDLSLQVVGIALDEPRLEERMAQLADAGGGGFFDASNADELVSAIESAITGRVTVGTRVRITADDGAVVGRGTVGGGPIDLEPGTYEVHILSPTPVVFEDVIVPEGQTIELALPEAT